MCGLFKSRRSLFGSIGTKDTTADRYLNIVDILNHLCSWARLSGIKVEEPEAAGTAGLFVGRNADARSANANATKSIDHILWTGVVGDVAKEDLSRLIL